MVDGIEVINLMVYNITNDAVNAIFNKYKKSFELSYNKLNKVLTKLKKYQDGSTRYSHNLNFSTKLHNPFILEKTANDYSFWLTEFSNHILELMNRISDYAGGSADVKTFTESLSEYSDSLPKVYDLRKEFLYQTPKDLDLNVADYYSRREWIESLDNSVNTCDTILIQLSRINTMIDLLNKHVERLKININNLSISRSGDYYNAERNIEPFLKYEMKVHAVLKNIIKKIVEYSILRFADLILVIGYIQEDLNKLKGELWK